MNYKFYSAGLLFGVLLFLSSCSGTPENTATNNSTVSEKGTVAQNASNKKPAAAKTVKKNAASKPAAKKNTKAASATTGQNMLNKAEWKNIQGSTDFNHTYKLTDQDLFANENWEQIGIKDYVEQYRYYKHNKGMYHKGTQKVFKLETKSQAKINKYKPQVPAIEKAFGMIGKPAPAYDFVDINGKKYNSDALKGKIVVFNFWFVGCPPCQKEIPELNELVAHYKNDKDVVFIAPSLNRMDNKLAPFLQKRPFDYSVTEMIPGLPQSFNAPAYPTHTMVDKKGNVQFVTVGGMPVGVMKKYMIEKIESLR